MSENYVVKGSAPVFGKEPIRVEPCLHCYSG